MAATVRTHGSGSLQAYLIHGGPGAQGSLHGLAASLELPCAEILQRRASDEPLTVQRHVEDMAQIITEPATLIGHSWGAMLSLSFASLYPTRCKQLILLGCGTFSLASRAEYERIMAERTDPSRKEALKAAIENAQSMEERGRAFAAYGAFSTNLQAFDPIPDPYPEPESNFDLIGHRETWKDVLRLQSEGIEPARFANINCPVTLIHGDHDPHVGRALLADLQPFIPQIKYIELPDCGHEPWLESGARDEFLQLLRGLTTAD
ncbi:alpha/beta hydrolase [Kamptonema cortianum]|nr:alpha/beta hydrolase [Geitlerinema splendidum]MDK3157728.1 alpha/beta hydrolase [Kamptonema cortianum]